MPLFPTAVERYASLRASQERMVYIPTEDSHDVTTKVVYTSKYRKVRKVFSALDWLARLVTDIPGRYEQTVMYYGWYSNKSRGMRKKVDQVHRHFGKFICVGLGGMADKLINR